MPQIKTTLDAEQEAFDKEVAEIKAWWDSSDKQRQLKRYVFYLSQFFLERKLISPKPAPIQPNELQPFVARSNRNMLQVTWPSSSGIR
jgi:hypothetical protein